MDKYTESNASVRLHQHDSLCMSTSLFLLKKIQCKIDCCKAQQLYTSPVITIITYVNILLYMINIYIYYQYIT